jgi:hypothetical protein
MSGAPDVKTGPLVEGIYYARVLPELSASIAVTSLGGGKFQLKADVTDAGDSVSGATVSAKGKSKTTNAKGSAKLTISGRWSREDAAWATERWPRPSGAELRLRPIVSSDICQRGDRRTVLVARAAAVIGVWSLGLASWSRGPGDSVELVSTSTPSTSPMVGSRPSASRRC